MLITVLSLHFSYFLGFKNFKLSLEEFSRILSLLDCFTHLLILGYVLPVNPKLMD